MIKKSMCWLPVALLGLLWACGGDAYTPKPKGYFRIDLPKKEYQRFDSTYPYTFEYPKYAVIQTSDVSTKDAFWVTISFPKLKANIHFTYKFIEKDIDKVLEETYTLAYKHSIKADAIGESLYTNDTTKVYGLLYDIQGNAASPKQFFLTDSVKHYLRGALYFNARPNKDSLAPVIEFLNQDIVHLMESLRWKALPRK